MDTKQQQAEVKRRLTGIKALATEGKAEPGLAVPNILTIIILVVDFIELMIEEAEKS